MHKPNELHVETARHLVAAAGGDATNAVVHLAASVHTFETLFACLTPIVGAAGVRSIFLRSVKLTAPQFGGLARVVEAIERRDALPDAAPGRAELLKRYVLGETPAVAVEMVVALLATFLELLSSLIGEALTARLLASAWPDVPGATRPIPQEGK